MVNDQPETTLIAKLEQSWGWDCLGQSKRALNAALEVRDAARWLGELALIAKASQYIAWFLRHLARSSEGVDFIQESRRLWTELGNQAEQARSGAIFAWLLLEFGDSEEAALEASEAFSIAERLGSDELLAFIGDIHALTLNQTGDSDAAIPIMDKTITLGRQLGDPHQLASQLIDHGFIYSCVAECCKEAGDQAGMERALAKAMASNDEAVAIARRHSDPWKLRIALTNGAELCAKAGDFAGANVFLTQWTAVPGKARGRLLREYDYARCDILTAAGRLDEARALCERSVAQAVANGVPHQELSAIRKLAELRETDGDYKLALESYKQYHAAYKKTAGEAIQRRVRLAALRHEIDTLRSRAEQADQRADRMAAEAEIDPLTGIANRRKYDRTLHCLEAAGTPYALAIVDLDHFKAINDKFSHLVGDDVLRMVADMLKLAVCEKDMVARIGGEEFALVLTDIDSARAEKICERFLSRLAVVAWGTMAPGLHVTASIGLASSAETKSARALISLADERLYAAKTAGRDCLVSMTGKPYASRWPACRSVDVRDLVSRDRNGEEDRASSMQTILHDSPWTSPAFTTKLRG